MLRRNILPLDLYEFDCPTDLLADVLQQVKSLTWVDNVLNSRSQLTLNGTPAFSTLHSWFDQCIEELRRELDLPFERLVITQSWANRSTSGEQHHRHTHPNCYLSAVLYLTDAEDGRTLFFAKDPWLDFFLIGDDDSMDRGIVHAESVRAGKLLVFPSSLEHSVEAHESAAPRYSIAFNAFPEGRFGFRQDRLSFLNLKVLPFAAETLSEDA